MQMSERVFSPARPAVRVDKPNMQILHRQEAREKMFHPRFRERLNALSILFDLVCPLNNATPIGG